MPKPTKLLGRTKIKITKVGHSKNVPYLEIIDGV